ncbi:SPOSA6832_04777 [Sporobolomyces salmonicolor]|uniref:SPOSA6832_04777-mRNA-1:cds n=1 Tax=Sporidiobolus salmonicolor TaxID=5005 RepID=A0A0D6ESZ7_SPOSA|nr:SPOSA6832_04777 [Sporobolomyces salmonicolor]
MRRSGSARKPTQKSIIGTGTRSASPAGPVLTQDDLPVDQNSLMQPTGGFYDPRDAQSYPGYVAPFPGQSGLPFAGGFSYPCPPPPVASTSQLSVQGAVEPEDDSSVARGQVTGRKRARNSSVGATGPGQGKKAVQAEELEDVDDDGTEDGLKRKRRLPLSCGECQRRKIKCDRSPYALSADVRAISRRLAHLESLFQQAHPALHPLTKPSPSTSTSHHLSPSLSTGRSTSHTVHPSPASRPAAFLSANNEGDDDPSPRSHSDTEDAVADLEEQTFGARVPVLRAIHAAAQGNARRYNYAGKVDMELTGALTSILAEPLTFDQDGRPRSAVRLGLDLAVQTADLPGVRHEALAQILAVLPGPEISQFLIKKYFTEMEWDFRVLDPEAFPLEHQRYTEMVEQGRQDLIDPLWIACFCMVLALSLEGFWSRPNGVKDLSLFGGGLTEQDLKDLPSVWHDAALRALQLGEWGGTPRVRTIQCIILFGQCPSKHYFHIQIASSSGQQGRFLGWAASAIRVAQRMGLHRLGSNPQTMPPDDPALPPGTNSLKREMAVRLFHHLVNVDSWLSDSPSFRCYCKLPRFAQIPRVRVPTFEGFADNTARPLNLNFRDLSRTDWRTSTPPPLTVYTAFRQVFENVPDVFAERSTHIDSPRIAYERACLHEDLVITQALVQVYSRIVRLNRPLLGRGYQPNSAYRYSTDQCVKAARSLILSNHGLLEIATSNWWMYTGTLASSIVLFMDLFHAIDHDSPENEIKEKRDILTKARVIFESKAATPALTVVVEEGRKILAALFSAEEARRTTRAAHDMVSAGPPQALETFAQLLKRVSREVAAEEQHQIFASNATALASPTPAIPPHPAPLPCLTFAQAAATALSNTPSAFDYPEPPVTAGQPDFSSFFTTLASEDWTATGLTSPTGDDSSLLDQMAATW